jgi:hypothetical protein
VDAHPRTFRRLRIALVVMSMLCALFVLALAGVAFYWKSYLLEPKGDPFTRGPFITRLSTTSAELHWRVEDDKRVTLAAVGADGREVTAREGRFSGLSPDTRYAWTADVDGAVRASGSFRTAPVSHDVPVTFGVIGDYGSGNDHEYAIGRVLAAQLPNFVLTAGDNSYLFGASFLFDRNIFQPLRAVMGNAPLWATLGDHDLFWRSGDDVERALDLPGQDGRYVVRYGPVTAVLLGHDPSAATVRWARGELQRSDAPFEFAVVHRPLQKGSPVLRMLRGQNVRAVFSGHLHRYERRTVDGMLNLTVGTSGQGPGDLEFTKRTNGADVSLLDYGALRVDVSSGKVRYTFIDEHGRVLDQVQR